MSTTSTLARLLTTTMRPALAAALGDAVSIRTANEDKTDKPLSLPAIVLAARDLDINYTVKVSGRYARDCELRAACRVDGTRPGSAEEVEALAATVEREIAPASADWTFFQPFRQADERTWEGNTRVVTLVWKLIALPAV
jgi:hypothetical protein